MPAPLEKPSRKVRMLRWARTLFPIWSLNKLGDNSYDLYASNIAQASAEKDHKRVEELRQEAYFNASEYWDEAKALQTRWLLREAQRYNVPILKYLKEDAKRHGRFGHEWLSTDLQVELAGLVNQKRRETWEFRIKLITALTGLLGAVSGVIALLSRFGK